MTAPEHDPATCATCSGERHDPEPTPLAEYLSEVVEILKAAQLSADDGPASDGRWA